MKRIARFEKVSKKQFSDAWVDTFKCDENVYDEIKIPNSYVKLVSQL